MFSFTFMWRMLSCLLLLFLGACQGGGAQEGEGEFAVSVVVAEAKTESVSDEVSLVGTLAANEEVEIQSEIDGIVEGIGFEEGQQVVKGAVLFRIHEEKLQAEVAQASANYKLAQANHKRAEELFKNRTISSQEYDKVVSEHRAQDAGLELARKLLEDATIIAPFDGVMGGRQISPGQRVSKGQNLTSVVNADPIKLSFSVPERYVGRLRTGLTVSVRVDAFPKETFKGEVYFISPRLDVQTRTLPAKAKIANQEGRLRPGMFASVEIVFSVEGNALMVPETALLVSAETIGVFVVAEGSIAEFRPVRLGHRSKAKVQVIEGVAEGEQVVAEGVQKIRPGVKLMYTEPASEEVKQQQERT